MFLSPKFQSQYSPGPGGLYAALILTDLGIPFQLLESSNRVGGRLFTYTFPNPTGAPYNYYDVGAMRFPDTPLMQPLFRLFQLIGIDKKLVPYYLKDDGITHNGVRKLRGDPSICSAETFENSKLREFHQSMRGLIGERCKTTCSRHSGTGLPTTSTKGASS